MSPRLVGPEELHEQVCSLEFCQRSPSRSHDVVPIRSSAATTRVGLDLARVVSADVVPGAILCRAVRWADLRGCSHCLGRVRHRISIARQRETSAAMVPRDPVGRERWSAFVDGHAEQSQHSPSHTALPPVSLVARRWWAKAGTTRRSDGAHQSGPDQSKAGPAGRFEDSRDSAS